MLCNALQVSAPNCWSFVQTDVCDINDGTKVEVAYSSICGTDREVLSGKLIYYKNGVAHYPIITGHEWCGIFDDQPVVGICILGCGNCKKCFQNKPMHCDSRKEVGVVNKNGAHADYVFMPESSLVAIPELLPKYALLEPLAVCVHALKRIKLNSSMRILISGYGCIGKLCGLVLELRGLSFEVYDPRYTDELEFYDFDIILECSGSAHSLSSYMHVRGVTILVFGFEYPQIDPSILSSNEMSIIGTLGSTLTDFVEAVDIMKNIEPDFFNVLPFEKFEQGLQQSNIGEKTVFEHRGV